MVQIDLFCELVQNFIYNIYCYWFGKNKIDGVFVCEKCSIDPEYREVIGRDFRKYCQLVCPICRYNIVMKTKGGAMRVWNERNK